MNSPGISPNLALRGRTNRWSAHPDTQESHRHPMSHTPFFGGILRANGRAHQFHLDKVKNVHTIVADVVLSASLPVVGDTRGQLRRGSGSIRVGDVYAADGYWHHHVVVLMRVLAGVITHGKGPSGDPHVGVVDLHLGIHIGGLVPFPWSRRRWHRRRVARQPTLTSRRSATSAGAVGESISAIGASAMSCI